MAYDMELAGRLRTLLGMIPGLEERKMFGGIGYTYRGNMFCGVDRKFFIVRVGPEEYEQRLAQPNVHPFALGERKGMTGWVTVDAHTLDNDDDLLAWIQVGVKYVRGLPPKKSGD